MDENGTESGGVDAPDLRNRKRGRFRLQYVSRLDPTLFLGCVFWGAVPVACLWLSLRVWAWSLLGRCLSALGPVSFRWGSTQEEKGHRPKNLQ